MQGEVTEEDDSVRTENEQLSISEDDGEQVREIDDLLNNKDYEQARIIEEENRILDEAEQIRNWAIVNNIKHKALNSLLAILRTRLLPELPKSSKTFLQTRGATYDIQEMEAADNSVGEFVYLGIANGLKKCIREDLYENDKILLQVNVDGVPLFKSSKKQFWPILCKVFFDPDIYAPFPVAIYSGNAKPMSADKYLHDFVEELNQLFAEGIIMNGHRFDVKIHSFICDTPARSFLKGVKGHGGFWACERCEIKGERINRRTVYPEVNCLRRTERSFRLQTQIQHHRYQSPLLEIEPPVDLVRTFVLDYMHLCCGGVMKKLTEFWISGKVETRLQRRNMLGSRQKHELSNLLVQLRKYIPSEFQRKTRDISHIAQWKATEYRFLLLYAGPVVLRGILKSRLYKHFLLFHSACRILCSNEYAFIYNAHAKAYLTSFFQAMGIIYGRQSQIINTHNLIHLADDVQNMNCILSKMSAFPFESLLGRIKLLIRNANRPLAQVCRRLHEFASVSSKASIAPIIQILKVGTSQNHDRFDVKSLKYKGFTLTTKSPNNLVLLENSVLLTVTKIICSHIDRQDVQVEGNQWKVKRSIFKYPTESENLKMWQLVNLPSRQIIRCDINRIECKMVLLQIKTNRLETNRRETKSFAISLLHE